MHPQGEWLDILAAGGGIISTVRNTREASETELVEAALARLDKMLGCGTTVCEIKTGYGLDTQVELRMLRVIEAMDKRHAIKIVPTFLAAHTIPLEFKNDTEGYVELICREMLPQAWEWYSGSHFISDETPFFVDIFCERNAFDLEHTKRIFQMATGLGFRLKAHVDQFTNLGGAQLGIESRAVSIDHLDEISEDEIALLASSETIGVVIPTENFNSGKTQFAPARKMIDAGCAIALTTDYNPGSAPCPSQPMTMAISCRYQKLLPAEALNAATINAAYAIGLGGSYGSIDVGKRADLNIIDAHDWRMLAYEFGGDLIAETIIDGWPATRDKERPI
ncbi:imidazolonepropionase [Leptolyngbya sp. 7M]|nr:imidazolonepropionase [Leptolyngbya sp. 7M]